MKFSKFSAYLEKLENTPSRLEMMYQLADLFKVLDQTEITKASYLMQGSLVPHYLSLEFQLSIKMVIRALARLEGDSAGSDQATSNQAASETSLFEEVDSNFHDLKSDFFIDQITKKYKESGDIGNVTEDIVAECRQSHPLESELSILDVYQKLEQIALDSGVGSQDRKINSLAKLLMNLDATSSKFVSRIIIGKLRLGFSAMTMLDALSWSVLGSKDHRKLLEDAYQKRSDVGELAKTYLEIARGIADKSKLKSAIATQLEEKYLVKVGIPVVPALCQRLNSSNEIIEKMSEVIVEPKYDGLRIQIHFSNSGFKSTSGETDKKAIKAFTRNLEDVTHMFPELEMVAKSLKCENAILDAEAIGFNKDTDELLPFQETITRKRKHSVKEQSQKVPIRFYVFDCLYLNNRSLLDEKLQERKKLLRGIFEDSETIKYTKTITTNDPKVLREFHEDQLGFGLEGAVMKQVGSSYKSGRKGWQWVKIKEEEGSSGKLKDTLDLVVMGYYFGRGKRSKFGVGAFLVGVLDGNQDLLTIAKIGTGLTDDQFIELKKKVDSIESKKKPRNYKVDKLLNPDVWVVPQLVVEIAADEITKSPSHTAGVALRFPRLIKFRDDKNWTDATTMSELENF